MFGVGPQELLVVAIIAVVFFMLTGRNPAEAGRKLGKSIKEVKEGVAQVKADVTDSVSVKENEDAQSSTPLDEIKRELDDIPGLNEARQISQTTSQLRRFTRFLGK